MNDTLSGIVALSAPVLAQMAVPEQSAAMWWLIGFVAVAAGVNQVVVLFRNLRGDSQRRQVSVEEGAQSRGTCREIHQKLEHELADIRQMLKDGFGKLGTENEHRASGLHKRIDPIAANVARVEGRIEDHLQDHRSGRASHG